MAARRLREPVIQMRQTLEVIKTTTSIEDRVPQIEALMHARGMKAADAARRLGRALDLAHGEVEWDFDLAWSIAWETIYWPHRRDEYRFERECVTFARASFELAWYGQPTPLMHLRGALEALEDARDEDPGPLTGAMVA